MSNRLAQFKKLEDALDEACAKTIFLETVAEQDNDESLWKFTEEVYKRLTYIRAAVAEKITALGQ